MARALALAARADYRTSPNPMVGAVVIDRDGAVAGEGFHVRAGEPHAEVRALEAAGSRARGATLYVNLEPCNHHGRTPPCTEAVIAAGIARAVIAIEDPDPRTAGGGIRRLREAGIDTEVGLQAAEASRVNRFFLHHRRTGRPWVTVKFGSSLDGKIATASGDSRWITGAEARAHAHRDRHRHDAILVGVGTVLADDPELTARFEGARQPLRVVLDSNLRTPLVARVAAPNTLFAAAVDPRPEFQATGADVIRLPAGADGRVDLAALLEHLGRRGILSLLVEGGATVNGAFFDRQLVDGITAYLAPLVIGGAAALGAVGGRGAGLLNEATRLQNLSVDRAGDDVIVSADVERTE
jgi:diaminohydroxyphosphoribosylaminopyrimidine deaminase / 5-amino-6-(5-phosphoribosylamino)uracil reductase